MPLPVYLLALAVFAMGTSEFMLAGLARQWPPRSSLLAFLGLFFAAHVLGAVTDDFTVLLATRVVAALANAGFLALALTATAALVPPDRKGRALAVLLGGTTIATVAGVPGGALLGAALGWRAAFWAVALLCLPAALGVLRGLPDAAPREQTGHLRTELRELRRPRLLLVMCLGALVNAATFGALTYIGLLVTATAGLGTPWIAVALVLFGLGSFIGVTAAGRFSDRRPGAVIMSAGPLLLLGWCALGLWAAAPAALFALAFVQGALAFAVGSTLIARVLYEAGGAPTMAGSYATAALNVGAAAGPVVAGAMLHSGAAERGPVWAAAIMVAAALLLALPAGRVFAGAPEAAALR